MIANSAHLLRPEYLKAMPFGRQRLIDSLEARSAQHVQSSSSPLGADGVSLVIRTMNEAGPLADLLDTVNSQRFAGEVEIIVVDNDSTDSTRAVAENVGATVVLIPKGEFTYPKSMNLGMSVASFNNVFLTVGHASVATCLALDAGIRWLKDNKNGGVYAPVIVGKNASLTEGLVYGIWAKGLLGGEKFIDQPSVGVMGGTNAFFRKDIWKEYGGFDQTLEAGGEDTRFASRMIKDGLRIVLEPLVTVHHSHGLGPVNFLKQLIAWNSMSKGEPSSIDQRDLELRRPDLDFS